MGGLYDTDVPLLSEQQAGLLRRLAAGEQIYESADWQNLAEAIEAVGESQSRELASRIATVLEHLIKLQASPAPDPRAGWRSTIRRERREVERLLADAQSLWPTMPAVILEELTGARGSVRDDLADRGETPRTDPAALSCTAGQVLGTRPPD